MQATNGHQWTYASRIDRVTASPGFISMTALTFTVPFFYSAKYVPPRKRNAVEATFAKTMEITIPNLNSMEAPVVATVTRDDGIRRVTREFVAYDGRYFTASKDNWHFPDPDTVDVGDFDASYLNLHPEREMAGFAAGKYAEAPDGPILCIENCYQEEYFEETLEARRQEVRDAAAKLIFVDGKLMGECQLPLIKARIVYSSGRHDRITIDVGERDEKIGSHGAHFMIDSLASALAWAKDRQARERDAEVQNNLEVEIHDPGLMPRNTLFAEEAVRVVQFIMKRDFKYKDQTDEFLLKFMVARRALKACLHEKSDENIAAMLETFTEMYVQYGIDEAVRLRRYNSSFDLDGDLDFVALSGITVAWENRPVQGETLELPSPEPMKPR
jgi:hypothetical protein